MKGVFKRAAAVLVTAVVAGGGAALSGCTVSLGVDGRDGQDVSAYDLWQLAKEQSGNPDLTYHEFLKEYLNYTGEEVEQMASLQAAINRSLLSSVQVTAEFTETNSSTEDFWPWPWGGGQEESESYISQGSGVIIDLDKEAGDMYVVTNGHVVYSSSADEQYSNEVKVYLYGREYTTSTIEVNGEIKNIIDESNAIEAEIVGVSLSYDIAVLRVEGSRAVRNSSVIAADWNRDENVAVGQTVYAVGNAAGGGISATNGIVAVDSEEISLDMYDTPSNYDDDFVYRTIRTSVPIYSGNSGGGLFDIDGNILGIVNSKTVAASEGEYSDNISHALPAASVHRVVQNMIDRYEATGSCNAGLYKLSLGAYAELNVVSSSAYMNNDTNNVEIIETVEVTGIGKNSFVYGSLQNGDRLVSVKITDGENNVRENCEIMREYNIDEVLLSAREGDTVCITVDRASQENPVSYSFTIMSGNFVYCN